MHRLVTLSALFSAMVLGGCACNSSESAPVTTEDTHGVIGDSHASAVRIHNEEEAIEAARRVVDDLGWQDVQYDTKPFDGGWSVMASRIHGYREDGNPVMVPGGHRLIQVYASGRVDPGYPGR